MTVTPPECGFGWLNECGCAHHTAPCWPRPPVDLCCAGFANPDIPEPTKERVLRIAVMLLWRATGKRFSLCPVTVRPCRDKCAETPRLGGAYLGVLQPYILDGSWFNGDPCGRCLTDCSCTEICEVTLPGPVESIVQVRQDGVVLEPAMYRVDDHRKLVRLPLTRVASGRYNDCVPNIPNAICPVTPDGDQMQIGGNDFDISPDGSTFTLLSNEPFAVVFGRGRRDPKVTMTLCPGAVMTWGNATAVSVTSDVALVDSTLQSLEVGAQTTTVTITFPSATHPNDTTTPVFTITGPDGCGRMGPGALSYLTEGEACWPTCQDLTKGPTEAGTWEVTYRRGLPVPEDGLWAAGLLACELLKTCSPVPCGCVLPSNVQQLAREGVTLDLSAVILDGSAFGRFGIPEVDLWVKSVNPYGVAGPSRVYSPDRRPPRTTTWPCP